MAASDVWDDGGCCDDKDEDDDDDDDAILPFSCLCHANAAHSRHNVLPVPVGDSSSALVASRSAATTPAM